MGIDSESDWFGVAKLESGDIFGIWQTDKRF